MSVRQFVNSLHMIWQSEHVNRGAVLARHFYWQVCRLAFPRPVRLRISRSVIMDNQPTGVISTVNILGLFDFNNMHFVQTVLARGAVFIDVGANIGAYTLIASEIPSARVISLEPIPAAFGKLEQNIALNERTNIIGLKLAASKQPGTLWMTCNGSSTLNRVVAQHDTSEETTMVQVDTFDEICRRLHLAPSLIKIDVEGHEPEVLAGAVECLASCSACVVEACVVENGDRAPIVAFMRDRGMAGPFYYRHRIVTLQRSPQPHPEDPIYISGLFAQDFPAIAIEGRRHARQTVAAPESPQLSFGGAGLDVR